MEKKQVSFKVDGHVMTVTIDNKETKNGLNWEGIEQFAECYAYAAEHEEIRVMVITGNDQYFYTGGRVDATVPGEKEKYADAIEKLTALQDANQVPVVAAVSGDCLKAGMGLLAESDFAVACEGTEFGFPEVRMGGAPMMVMAETIDAMPKKKALEAYYTSWNFSAKEALEMGLLNAVVSREDFQSEVDKYVNVFLNTPKPLISITRKAYVEMAKAEDIKSRRQIAMRMLREEVLTTMAKTKTSYNV